MCRPRPGLISDGSFSLGNEAKEGAGRECAAGQAEGPEAEQVYCTYVYCPSSDDGYMRPRLFRAPALPEDAPR